jgi:hypothetical protein
MAHNRLLARCPLWVMWTERSASLDVTGATSVPKRKGCCDKGNARKLQGF